MLKYLILYFIFIATAYSEEIDKNKILNILKEGKGIKTNKVIKVKKVEKKDNNTAKKLPVGQLPHLPISSIELANIYDKNYTKKITQKNNFFINANNINSNKKIKPGEYAKEIKFYN